MKKSFNVILASSLALNCLFLSVGIAFLAKKGGLSYVTSKLGIFNQEKPQPKPKSKNSSSSGYRDYRKSHYAELPLSQDSIVLLGDSLTDFGEWSELFPNLPLKNRGISKETAEQLIDRIDYIWAARPHKVFILIGANDLNKGLSIKDFIKDYEAIVKELRDNTPKTKIYLQSLLPVNQELNPKLKLDNQTIVKANQELTGLANKYQVVYIDLFTSFLDGNNQLNPQYSLDGLHLNGQGYFLWQELLEEYIGD